MTQGPIRISIVDYEMGNLRSVQKAFESIGQKATVTRSREAISESDALVLPGVGAFRDCMANLDRMDLTDSILEFIATGKPFLGICLGLQLLFSESEEFGIQKGLNLIPGRVVRFPDGMADSSSPGTRLKVPHMGWNQVRVSGATKNDGVIGSSLFRGIPQDGHFYFVHSYYAIPDDPSVIVGTTRYGIGFCSALHKDNVYAVQFHPEKSQANGVALLSNFVRICREFPSPTRNLSAPNCP